MTTMTELKAQILTKASEDGEFRASLMADPKAVLSAETGTTIPDGFDLVVREDSSTTVHLVLPPSPQLTEVELEKVAGGIGGYWEGNPFPP